MSEVVRKLSPYQLATLKRLSAEAERAAQAVQDCAGMLTDGDPSLSVNLTLGIVLRRKGPEPSEEPKDA